MIEKNNFKNLINRVTILALSEETGEGTQKSPTCFSYFSGEMGMHLDNRIPIHQIHSCCYARA